MSELRGIKRVEALEERARYLATELARVELEWDKRMSHLRARYPKEWRAYCEKRGSVPDYNFGDLLC